MKTSIMLVSVLAVLAATPAAAGEFDTGDSYGPRGPVATQGIGFPAKANGCPTTGDVIPLACGVVPGTGWNPYGTVTLTPAELNAQTTAHKQYHAELRARIIASGGVNADILPLWMAERLNETAFGGPRMGSTGGSD